MSNDANDMIYRAYRAGSTIPAFNVPYIPMMEPIVKACVEEDVLALVAVARIEWTKFEAGGPEQIKRNYDAVVDAASREHVLLHLDHVPVIDEDDQRVDYRSIVRQALDLGYDSVMVDGSRLSLEDNIAATREVVELAHAYGAAVEAELGSVYGHEEGPPPPYEELFQSKRGFTDPEQARQFVRESGCDWLSVAFGSIHGAVSRALRDQQKPAARLDLEHLQKLVRGTGIPLVLHGGSGVQHQYLQPAFRAGVAKMNIGTEIRQAYEQKLRETGDQSAAQQAVFDRTRYLLRDYLELSGSRTRIGATSA
jgi:ketose-bisphosphate aldolase